MPKILILLVHPTLEKSKANQMLLDSIPSSDAITLHDLYEEYPNFSIQVKAEQNLVLDHDIILFQHPLYWYSCPPLMKLWMDMVLEDGWAYGVDGNQLVGKKWIQVITTGGSKDSYSKGGFHGYATEDFLLPFRRTAELCGMDYLPPFLVQGTFQLNELALQKESNRYLNFINNLLGGIYG